MSDTLVLKINHQNDIRRLSIPLSLSLENFLTIVKAMFKELQSVELHYIDSDNDKIRVVTDHDWRAAIEFGLEKKLLRIDITAATSSPNAAPVTNTPVPSKERFQGPDVSDYDSSGEWVNWFSTTPLRAPVHELHCNGFWADQGWGNQKGSLAASIVRNGIVMHTVNFALTAPHSSTEFTRVIRANELCATLKGDTVQLRYLVGGGGGHQLFIDHAVLEVHYRVEEENVAEQPLNDSHLFNAQSGADEAVDPALAVFAGRYTVWERRGAAASWAKTSTPLVITPAGRLERGARQIHEPLVIPDGDSLCIGWNYNYGDLANDTQGEVTVTFGAQRGYYWDEEISTENITFEGWLQAENDVKVDVRGIVANLNSWEYLQLDPEAATPVVQAEYDALANNAQSHGESNPQNLQGEHGVSGEEALARVASEQLARFASEQLAKEIQGQEETLEAELESVYVTYLGELRDSVVAFEGYLRRSAVRWEDEHTHAAWVAAVREAQTAHALAAQVLALVARIDTAVFSWPNGEHATHTPKLRAENVSSREIAAALLGVEVSVTWDGVVEQFRDARAAWVNALNSFPSGLRLQLSTETDLARFSAALQRLAEFMVADGLTWSGDHKLTWATALSIAESAEDVTHLLRSFLEALNAKYINAARVEALIGGLAQGLSVGELCSVLLDAEVAIGWAGVVDAFADARAQWRHGLGEISARAREQKLFELGDLTSRRVGVTLVKSALLDFEAYMRREAMDWYLEEEREGWQRAVRSADEAESVARLLSKFIGKIKAEFVPGWAVDRDVRERGLHQPRVKVIDLAAVLLALEVNVPWDGVVEQFRVAREDWRHTLTQLQNALSANTPYRSVLAVIKNALVLFENYLIRSVVRWDGAEARKAWKAKVTGASTLAEFAEAFAALINVIDQHTFSEYNANAIGSILLAITAPHVRIQTLIQSIVSLEANIPWSAVVPSFQSDRSNWLSTLTSLPQYAWSSEQEDDELVGPERLEAPVLRNSAFVRASVRQSVDAKKQGLLHFEAPGKSTLELIAPGVFKAYSLNTLLEEGDRIKSTFQLQSFPNENFEFDWNLITSENKAVLKVLFSQAPNTRGLVRVVLMNRNGELEEVASSRDWANSFPFSPSQDFELVLTVGEDSVKLVFDDVFTLTAPFDRSAVDGMIKRICLVGRSGRILAKSVNLTFARSVTLIPE